MPHMSQTPADNQGTGQKQLPVCKWCGRTDHYQTFCNRRPKKPLTVRKRPNKVGRVGKATANAVAKWKRTQRPNHQGYYECYMCGKWVTYLEAEHVKSKVRHPELRTDPNNLKPCCGECNEKKRSKDN